MIVCLSVCRGKRIAISARNGWVWREQRDDGATDLGLLFIGRRGGETHSMGDEASEDEKAAMERARASEVGDRKGLSRVGRASCAGVGPGAWCRAPDWFPGGEPRQARTSQWRSEDETIHVSLLLIRFTIQKVKNSFDTYFILFFIFIFIGHYYQNRIPRCRRTTGRAAMAGAGWVQPPSAAYTITSRQPASTKY